jgi:predicted RNase H-like nuclease (RuvC/YqgF family)
MPRCKNGTRKNKKTGECETYTKPVSKSQRATKKMEKTEAKAQAKTEHKQWEEEEYKDRLEEAREEFFEDKQYMYDKKNLLEVEIGDEVDLPAKRKKELASTIKKVEALEKRIIRKHRLKKTEWVGDVERITVGMMEDHRPGEFLKPPHERKRGMW